jgi:hypothetical protein
MGTTTGVGSFVLSVCGYIICGFLGVLAATIIIWIWRGKMDLGNLLNEGNGQASMSRFQLLIFTFVIAISLFELVEKSPTASFPDIPQGVLTLLGISASTYAVGKGSLGRPGCHAGFRCKAGSRCRPGGSGPDRRPHGNCAASC